MVAAGAAALMAANEGSTNKGADSSIATQFGAHHTQQLASDNLIRRSTRSGSSDSSRKKESPTTSNRNTSIRETKTSRLRAASIFSPADGSRKTGISDNLPSWNSPQSSKSLVSYATGIPAPLSREKEVNTRVSNKTVEPEERLPESCNFEKSLRRSKRSVKQSALLASSQTPSMTHRQNDSKENVRQRASQQSTSDIVPRSLALATSHIPKRTSPRSGSHDSTEVLQRVDALTALTKATMERVERLTSSASSSSSSSSVHTSTTTSSTISNPSIDSSTKLQYIRNSSKISVDSSRRRKNLEEMKTVSNRVPHQSPPISILKYKSVEICETISNESNSSGPVSVSSFEIEESLVKKPGILKKRSSLDENEILRRTNCRSPDFVTFEGINGSADCRPILKNERRSSLDELLNAKRPESPDYPASILKRKWSRSGEEDREENSSSEPQSILKKHSQTRFDGKSNDYYSNSSVDNSMKSLGVTWTDNDVNQEVRPILKKKLSREESSSSDPPSLEPRPILKKKSSTESDEHEDKPKKTILKSSRRSSEESCNESETNSPKSLAFLRNRSLQRRTNSLPECDSQLAGVRPILKNSVNFLSERSSRSDNTSPNDPCLRKRARSVGPDGHTASKTNFLDDQNPSHNCSSITPIVSFKLSSREESVHYCEKKSSQEIMMSSNEANLRKLDECAAKIRRARHNTRRYRDHDFRDLSGNSSDLQDTYVIDSNVIERTIDVTDTENTIHQSESSDSIGEGRVDGYNGPNNFLQMTLRSTALEEQVKVSSAKDNQQLQSEDKYDRFNTQPVTNREVKEAVLLNREKNRAAKEIDSCCTSLDGSGNSDHVDPSKLSLSERVRLFNRRIATESVAKAARSLNRVQRRPFSRFRTQPVTSEEVEDAARSIPDRTTDHKRTPSDMLVNQQSQPPKSILKSSSSHVLSENYQQVESSHSNSSESLEDSDPPVVLRRVKYTKSDLHYDNGVSQGENMTASSSKYCQSSFTSTEINNVHSTKTNSEGHRVISIDERDNLHCKTESESQSFNQDATRSARPMSAMQSLDFPSISIRDRLAALQRSGSTDWKRRVTSEPVPSSLIIEKPNFENDSEKNDIFQKEKEEIVMKQGRLADRLEKLESAAEGWRKRVTVADAVKFSVAGKMRVDQPDSFNLNAKPLFESMGNCSSDRKKKVPKTKELNRKGCDNDDLLEQTEKSSSENVHRSNNGLKTEDSKNGQVESIQHIPRADDETFTSFFDSVSVEKCREESFNFTGDDLDLVTSFSERLGSKRTVQVQRRRVPTKNPLRTLAARTDLKDEYTEITTGVADRLIKMNNIEKLGKNSSLAVEALAGLASTENFSAVTLKDAEKTGNGTRFDNKLRPLNSDIMLILIKGRRHVQVRLVEPVASSVNSGDNYILFTRTEIYNYVGKYSNVIERSRAAEIALRIQKNKDLGCRAGRVITLFEEKEKENATIPSSNVRKFWKILGMDSNPDIVDAGHPDEDEFYESALIDTNVVYELSNEQLIPLDKYWGTIPKIKMLDPSKVLVFDFGSEVYIWNGKCVPMEKRKIATRLTEQLWNDGYDYSECAVSPIDAASIIGGRQSKINDSLKKSSERPSWCLLVKLTQHMETILFREKFLDWPNVSGVIKMRRDKGEEKEQVDSKIVIEPPDVNLLISSTEPVVDLVLEGSHLGRGAGWFDEEFNRQYLVATTNVSVWHIEENSYTLLKNTSSIGQFFSGDSYIVRWMYTITVTGRELSGLPSKHAVEGRDRCAYFIWQGKNASLNKQGTAALLTVELDKEQGPQMRLAEGFEPPAFLNLFNGSMVVHSGKKSESRETSSKSMRAYICRGTEKTETFLLEVPCSPKQLRSRGSLIFIDKKKGSIDIWHGKHSLPHIRTNALHAANKLKKNQPAEVGFSPDVQVEIREMNEGEEAAELFQANMNKKLHVTLTRKKAISNYTPRLFHFSSISGEYTATELFGVHRAKDTTPFPFLQEELYQANQPALFLFDNKDELWLWQGWWPDTGSDDQTGSGAVRWQAERRAAMTVAIQYWKRLHPDSKKCPVYLVWAGLEPLEFSNLFPTWTYRDDVAELNIQDGRTAGLILSVESELARLTQSTYPPAQLLQRPLPEGVDPTSLELYLSPQHFQELLKMKIEEFQQLPSWKQIDIKKKIGLF